MYHYSHKLNPVKSYEAIRSQIQVAPIRTYVLFAMCLLLKKSARLILSRLNRMKTAEMKGKNHGGNTVIRDSMIRDTITL